VVSKRRSGLADERDLFVASNMADLPRER